MKIKENKDYVYYVNYYDGKPVRFLKEKATGKIMFNANDAVRMLGLGKNFEDFVKSGEIEEEK